MKNITKLLLCCLPFASCASSSNINTTTVPELDLDRFLGRWYEVARFNHSFERGLVGCTAQYSLQDGGTIRVVNSGYKKTLNGKFKQSVGKARRPTNLVPGQLEVSFFLWFYSDYNVMMLADDYRYALIGSSTDKYLWILSRTPMLRPDDKQAILAEARRRGYDTNKLLWVEQ